MKTFEFSVIASGLDPGAGNFEALFYDNGCDDALVSFQNGHIIIDFAREAETMDEAISSALENVAATGAHVDRVDMSEQYNQIVPTSVETLADLAAEREAENNA